MSSCQAVVSHKLQADDVEAIAARHPLPHRQLSYGVCSFLNRTKINDRLNNNNHPPFIALENFNQSSNKDDLSVLVVLNSIQLNSTQIKSYLSCLGFLRGSVSFNLAAAFMKPLPSSTHSMMAAASICPGWCFNL